MDLEAMLEDMGASVVGPANNIDDAMKLAKAAQIDLAFLDINLGGHRSTPVADLLRRRDIPFVFLTGYERDQLPPELGEAEILSKPISQMHISATLKRLNIPPNSAA